ncbi:MAG: hypothetical protein RLY86_2571 [Pseudomonadota bacterium]|jgi:ParB family chromosome partitioning protein
MPAKPVRKGLGSLSNRLRTAAGGVTIPEEGAKIARPSFRVRTADVYPDAAQPRRLIRQEGIATLARSFERLGQLEPVLVRRRDEGGWQLVAGERRWRAALSLGWDELSAIETLADPVEVALVENLQREDLTPFEEADGLARLMDERGYTQDQAADLIGRGQSDVSRLLRLRTLPPLIRQEFDAGVADVPRSTLLEIARAENADTQLDLWRQARTGTLSVREARAKRTTRTGSALPAMSRVTGGARRLELVIDTLQREPAALPDQTRGALLRLRDKLNRLLDP